MQRNSLKKLTEWKNNPHRKPLVLYGIRQVGKTWLMKEFGAAHYKKLAYISFDNNTQGKNIFAADFNISRLIQDLSIETGVPIKSQDTLIVFDEVQECPRALTSLKYFAEEAPEYHVMAAGSLLGVMSLEGSGFPVGKVETLTLYPMTFIEFLDAIDPRFVEPVSKGDTRQLEVFHEALMHLVQHYLYVGGMPEAVLRYAETGDLAEVRKIHHTILDAYYADFAKHIPPGSTAKVRAIWDSVPTQLAKENKRYLYSDMKRGSRGRDYETALQWLKDAGLVIMLNRVSLPLIPLVAYKEMPIFKLYMPDIGLLSARTSLSPKVLLDKEDALFTHYKGLLAEQYVLQELTATHDHMPLYYWGTEKNTAELEFLIQYENRIIPMEVKSGKNIKSTSLRIFKNTYNPEISIRFSARSYSRNGGNYEFPLYMAGNVLDRI